MTPSDPVERATIYSIPIGLPEEQIKIVSDEIDSVLIGLTQDLVHLDGKPDPGGCRRSRRLRSARGGAHRGHHASTRSSMPHGS
jgi:hypothetical protein